MAAHLIQGLGFWYNSGPGQPTSAAQGTGYVQEPVSRLTQMPITNFNSTVNDTILSFHQVRYVSMIHNLTFSCNYHCP